MDMDTPFPWISGFLRAPTDEEKLKLNLYLMKLEYGTLDGLTEEERYTVRAAPNRIAVFDRFRGDDGGFDHKHHSIMLVIYSHRYVPSQPFYYDLFAWYETDEDIELHQITSTSGYLQMRRSQSWPWAI
jgi:hypothetical protein